LNGSPNPTVNHTDMTGQWGFANVTPGLRTLTATRTDNNNQRIGTISVLVRQAAITFTPFPPTP
jgi:hypothetical protein